MSSRKVVCRSDSQGKVCAAVADYVERYKRPTATCSPGIPALGSHYAVVTGTMSGRRVAASLIPSETCFVPKRLVNDLFTATNLRAFLNPN